MHGGAPHCSVTPRTARRHHDMHGGALHCSVAL